MGLLYGTHLGNPHGLTHMGPMPNPVALPIWVAHMGPISACLLGCCPWTIIWCDHARIQEVLSERGCTTLTFLLVDEGKEDPNTSISISGLSWAPRETSFKWCFACVPIMAQH